MFSIVMVNLFILSVSDLEMFNLYLVVLFTLLKFFV